MSAIQGRTGRDWYEIAQAAERDGRAGDALEAYRQSLRLNPRAAAAYVGLARLLQANGQRADTVRCLEGAASAEPGNAAVLSMLAQALAGIGDLDAAERRFEDALAIDPDHAPSRFGLGALHEDRGRPGDAAENYRRVDAGSSEYPGALGALLGLGRHLDLADEVARAREIVATSHDDRLAALVGYGLGKELERQGAHDEAFAAYAAANAARRREAGGFDRAAFARRIDRLIAVFSADFFAARDGWGNRDEAPVFVVGLPRSGTSLTEQILASHPAVFGAGEIDALPDLATGLPDRLGDSTVRWPDCVEALTQSHVDALAGDYLRRLTNAAPRVAVCAIDKTPLNFLNLGLVALAFPRARIIHCERDIRDNGVSIFAENFTPEQRWATDLGDIAHYWRGCRRLMAHWRSLPQLRITTASYSTMVADLEAEARRLIDFLGLPWHDACLDFHANPRAVQTPSRWQVRQPLYTSSDGRWRRFEACIQPLIDAREQSE